MKIFGWIQCKLRNSNAGLLKESGNGNNQHGFEEVVFPGFLSIGTLNMASEPATPTFGFAADETPHEHKMELEKLFSVESENGWFGESKRSTLHPLEGYLFASSYELSVFPGLSVHVVEKKDDSILIRKYKAAAHHMRRILQPRNAVVGDGASTDSSSTRRKFREIKQLVRRKVHPAELRAVKESIKGNTENHSHGNGGTTASREHFDEEPLKKSNDKNVEHWIRSDADYVVLELGRK